jgi:hypothetical protein
MTTGTKSLLFGVHQFIWHPVTVLLAWVKLYGWPTWKQLVCIIVHDWGYWGSPNMDDERGEQHPRTGAMIALRLFGYDLKYYDLVLNHSRHLARTLGHEPSPLCWADKRSIMYDPPWFYLLRARLSGEIKEYRVLAAQANFVPETATDQQWLSIIRDKFELMAKEKRGDVVEYCNPAREG